MIARSLVRGRSVIPGGFAAGCARGAETTAQSAPDQRSPDHRRQPSADWLAGLKAQGYEAVVYLAPATVADAVREEPLVVSRQGLIFVNIPIRWDSPSQRDFEKFSAVMMALASRKVLVHCQMYFRASAMVFLHRAIAGREDPASAYESVRQIWIPEGPWKTLIQELLRIHGIDFDPF